MNAQKIYIIAGQKKEAVLKIDEKSIQEFLHLIGHLSVLTKESNLLLNKTKSIDMSRFLSYKNNDVSFYTYFLGGSHLTLQSTSFGASAE